MIVIKPTIVEAKNKTATIKHPNITSLSALESLSNISLATVPFSFIGII